MVHIVATSVLVVAAFTLAAQATVVMRPQFDEVNLESEKKYIKHKISLDNNAPGLNFTLEVLHDIKDLRFTISLNSRDMIDPDMGMGGTLSLSLCEILSQTKEIPGLKKTLKKLKKFGKIFDSCPIKKGSYHIKNIWYNEKASNPNAGSLGFEFNLEVFAKIGKEEHRVINDKIIGKTVLKSGEPYKHW